jgi:pimeloyl-ACP methyl ester carboxylesterase
MPLAKKEQPMKSVLAAVAFAATLTAAYPAVSAPSDRPTIVLVHGAFADASSWNGVVSILQHDGYRVTAVANPLRSVASDSAYVHGLLGTIKTPVVLVGHSYGGMVISSAANGQANVKALVFVAAFAPDVGESAGGLDGKFPGAVLGPALATPVALPGGGHDLYVLQDKFHDAFAPDLPEAAALVAAAEQRPITDIAFGEPAAGAPAWKTIPSWFVYGDHDTAIPPQAHAFMALRAHARATVVVKGASHVVMISHPDAVAKMIEDAATAQ